MVIAFVVIAALISFPFFVDGFGYFDYAQKKLFFSLRLFKIFQIFGGYIELYKGLFIIHYKKNKAIAFGIFDGGMRFDYSFLKDFTILELKADLSLPITEKTIKFAVIEKVIAESVFPLIKANNAEAKIVQNIDIGKDDYVKIYIKIRVLFNLIGIIKLLIKTLGGKNGKKRKN